MNFAQVVAAKGTARCVTSFARIPPSFAWIPPSLASRQRGVALLCALPLLYHPVSSTAQAVGVVAWATDGGRDHHSHPHARDGVMLPCSHAPMLPCFHATVVPWCDHRDARRKPSSPTISRAWCCLVVPSASETSWTLDAILLV